MKRIILRTLCGCERVFAENGILSGKPESIYVPLPRQFNINIAMQYASSAKAPVRQFKYWGFEGDDDIYLEWAE